MQVIHWGRARKFFHEHKPAEKPLKEWRSAVQAADWKNFPDVRKTFTTADWVDGKIVFDIKGNDFRLIAICQFDDGKLYIRHVLTHEEYDERRRHLEGEVTCRTLATIIIDMSC